MNSDNNSSLILADFSNHLFWDTNREKIDLERNAKWLIGRVLEYGLLTDWIIIKKYYGINRIAIIAKEIRNLDLKSMSFISVLSGIPKEEFLCYITKQSNPKHWNF